MFLDSSKIGIGIIALIFLSKSKTLLSLFLYLPFKIIFTARSQIMKLDSRQRCRLKMHQVKHFKKRNILQLHLQSTASVPG